MTHFEWLPITVLLAVVSAGCQSPGREIGGDEHVKPEYDATGRLTRITFDRDHDGKIDTWGFMDGARVIRVEVDENGDGKVDRWEYHEGSTGSGRSPAGTGTNSAAAGDADQTVARIDRARHYDGVVSRREYFDHGELTRVEEDTDGNGKIDKWETYAAGTLEVMALDTKGRGTPDRRLIYQSDGTLSRIEVDPSGSGAFQALPK